MASLERFLLERLRLKVNRDKSAVAPPWERKFLGYTVRRHGKKLQVAPKSIDRLRAKLMPLLRRATRGRKLQAVFAELAPIIRGWTAYFRLAEVRAEFEALDKWVRRRIRCAMWRRWKKPRTRMREMHRLGVDAVPAARTAYSGHGPWWCAGTRAMSQAVPASTFASMGLVSFLDEHRRLMAM
jgi:RNA-directed DNA polymerase